MNNITPRSITASDTIDQSRDVSGLKKWSRSSRTVDFIMSVLGWFAIPAEVFLRRDFGQRWFTTVNYYAGLFLLLIFATVQYLIALVAEFFHNLIDDFVSSVDPFYEAEGYDLDDTLMEHSMQILLVAYLLMGAYHLFKIWWRNRTGTALHSFSDGTSRLEPVGNALMQLLNAITAPIVKTCLFLMPKKQRMDIPVPELIGDRTAFTNTVIEPLVLLFLAYKLDGMLSLWLFISAIALAIHASWRETAKLNKILDFSDSILDAKAMMQLRSETQQPNIQQEMMQQVAATLREAPQITLRVAGQYPDLMDIIEDMNNDRSHLQTS